MGGASHGPLRHRLDAGFDERFPGATQRRRVARCLHSIVALRDLLDCVAVDCAVNCKLPLAEATVTAVAIVGPRVDGTARQRRQRLCRKMH